MNSRYISATATDANNNTSEFSESLAAVSTVPGLTLVVTNLDDSGPGTLREAIIAANAAVTDGDRITFNVAGPGPHLFMPTNPLPSLTDPGTTIDGYTQPGASSNTLAIGNNAVIQIRIDGSLAGFNTDGLRLESGQHTIRGLCLTGFRQSAIHAIGHFFSVIEGNFIGVEVDGVTARANFNNGILIENSALNIVGGARPEARNILSGNSTGVRLLNAGSTANRIFNNYIGTTASGQERLGNSTGIVIQNAPGNQIGGAGLLEGNVISGNSSHGINLFSNGSTNNSILGNFVGTDPSGTVDLGNNSGGINLGGGDHNEIGRIDSGAGNTIAFNQGDGVSVVSFNSTGNAIRGNSISENGGLGIDLGNSGVTTNDLNDVDNGANLLQNFPILTTVTGAVGQVSISGNLQSTPDSAFLLDFYSNLTPDPSAHGEGRTFLGSASVDTDGSGNAPFNVIFATTIVGRHISSTATDTNNNTSEFSPTVVATSFLPGITLTVTNLDDSGPGTLREAILGSNLNASRSNNVIRFNLPGDGPHVIEVLSALPSPSDPVVIDGFSQPGSSENTLAIGNNASHQVFLSGANAPFGTVGLTLRHGGVTVRGLGIENFNRGFAITSPTGNIIAGCIIRSNSSDGIHISDSPGEHESAGRPLPLSMSFRAMVTASALKGRTHPGILWRTTILAPISLERPLREITRVASRSMARRTILSGISPGT